jgi:hypothetical protein
MIQSRKVVKKAISLLEEFLGNIEELNKDVYHEKDREILFKETSDTIKDLKTILNTKGLIL